MPWYVGPARHGKDGLAGRPFCYAAAVEGLAGVRTAIQLMKQEVGRNMAMLGVTSVDDLDESYLWTAPGHRVAR